MEEMNKLVVRQQEIGNDISKLLSNSKKDTAARKTAKYIEERQAKLEAYHREARNNHTEIIKLKISEHDYYATNFMDQIEAVYNTAKAYLNGLQNVETDGKMDEQLMRVKRQEIRIEQFYATAAQITKEREMGKICKALYNDMQRRWEVISDNEVEIQVNEVRFAHEYFTLKKFSEAQKEYYTIQGHLRNEYEDNTTRKSKIELPKIRIPTFRTGYENWTPFHDLFQKLIHSNEELSDTEKMHYLKGHLDGEAAKLIQHLPITEQNYATAWDILKNRYHNVRLMVSNLLGKMMGTPAVEKEDAEQLKRLHDTIRGCLEAINNLGTDTASWGPIVIKIVSDKWDVGTNKLFEQSLKQPSQIPELEEVMGFLKLRFQSLEASEQRPKQSQEQSTSKSRWQPTSAVTCYYCKQHHSMERCPKFQMLAAPQKMKIVRAQQLCIRCMKHHQQYKCYSTINCATCSRPHHTMLHTPYNGTSTQAITPAKSASHAVTRSGQMETKRQDHQVLLATAMVRVQDIMGDHQVLRVLVDPGSQASFITEQAAQELKLPRTKITAMVSGLGNNEPKTARSQVMVHLQPRHSSKYMLTTELIVLPKITENLPRQSFKMEMESWQNVVLADPTLNISGPIDILLGAHDYAKIMMEGIKKTESELLGQQTQFGWVISGQIAYPTKKGRPVLGMVSVIEEDKQLAKFWELEEVDVPVRQNEEDQWCEDHYIATTTRGPDGRYTVRIPFKEEPKEMAKSRPLAAARLRQLEKKLEKYTDLREKYNSFMQEYLELGHMQLVEATQKGGDRYYIPHQPVIKESSTTTKLRVVYDASATSKPRKSLNEILHAGPRLQQELADILLRWRKHQFVFTADIQKMFRQINIHKDDQLFQTILWRDDQHQPIGEYQLTTVTYGTTAAPYLAVRTLQQLAQDEKESYPIAAEVAQRDFYVDDVFSGANSIAKTIKIKQELTNMLTKGGFQLHKWSSNNGEVLNATPNGTKNLSVTQLENAESRRSLGVLWIPQQDVFTFKIEDTNYKLTKRNILSAVAKIFDPLGWLSPITISAKLFIQKLWLSGLAWDQELPEEMGKEWKKFQDESSTVGEIQLPRWIHYCDGSLELHGFCDASEKAYGAVIYTKSSNGKISLLTAKSKVAPAKSKPTLPKLELCAAVLLAKLVRRSKEALQIKNIAVYAWTDSTITLAWITGDPSRWTKFVANRVVEINSILSKEQWRHVRTDDNPADVVSRGTTASKLRDYKLWWNGPSWLTNEEWRSKGIPTTITELEVRECLTTTVEVEDNRFLERFSSLSRLVHVTAYCNRFINHCRKIKHPIGHLEVKEIEVALMQHIKQSQRSTYKEELDGIRKTTLVNKNSKLLPLHPFQDQDEVLRVGGRLRNSKLPYHTKHPIILDPKVYITRLLILDAHHKTLHGGLQITLAYLRRRYWIINGRKAVHAIITKCTTCIRYKKRTAQQLMGDLPAARITPSFPFQHCGIDYAGPLQVRAWKGRGHKSYKGYVAVFICLATRAIHLEVVSDMTTEAFIAALKRFTARRGRCQHIYSDNGTNFVGASKILEQVQPIVQGKDVQEESTSIGTQWHFIPPASPHIGGIWESGVKSLKYHLRRVIGEATLTYEELATLTQQIEACLNSRPLTNTGEVVDDSMLLTPAHFLIGKPILEPFEETGYNNVNLGSRWKLLQKMKREFWKAWSTEYLHNLQQRYKWKTARDNIKVKDVVLIKEDHLTPGKWPLARIEEVHPAEDGTVRVVTVTKADGKKSKRSIHQLIPLHSETGNNEDRVKPSTSLVGTVRSQRIGVKALLIAMLLMVVTTGANYTITYPKPGLYVEHIGEARIERGIFRIEVQYSKTRITEDMEKAAVSIDKFKALCNNVTSVTEDSHCETLVQHMDEQKDQLRWLQDGLHHVIGVRERRGILGNILTSVFGVNDEVYREIDTLNKNQQEVIRNSEHQTKIMLSAISTFNDTETRITNQLERFRLKLNEGIEAINRMEKWYRQIDENKLNIQVLNTYQLAMNLVSEIYNHYHKVLKVHYQRGSFYDLLSEAHIRKVILTAQQQLPSNMEILAHPIIRTMVKQNVTHISVFGVFVVAEITEYVIMKITPIPLKMENSTVWVLSTDNNIISVDYNNQLYFELTEEEFKNSLKIEKHKFLCAPTVVKKMEDSPNCIIREIYNHTENNNCNIQQHTITSIIWKQLYMENTWMFITKQPTRVAIICNGRRHEVMLNNTGIINLSQDCRLQTRQSILNPRRDKSIMVLGSYIKHVNISTQHTKRHPHHAHPLEEPVVKAGEQLNQLRDKEQELQNHIRETAWQKVTTHSMMTSTLTTIIIIAASLAIGGGYIWYKRRQQPSRQTTEDIKMEPIYAQPETQG